MTRIYSPGITIMAARSKSSTVWEALSGNKATDFINTTARFLDRIKMTASGAALMAEMDASGHVVKIYRTWTADDGNCEFGEVVADSMVVPLDKVHGKGDIELGRVIGRATADMSQRSKLAKFFGIGRIQPKFLKIDALARLIGVPLRDLEGMMAGTKPIPLAVESKVKSYLYDFLTPGPGSDCGIRFNHTRDKLSTGHRQLLPASDIWENRPPGVALGHEMVHAWRCMIGKVLFQYGWEEEAMTVGLPPFSNMPFTENRLRVEWGGLAVRGDYKYKEFKSGMFDDNSKIGIGQNKEWLGDHKNLAASTKNVLAAGLADRRRAMGYDDDGFDDD